MVNQPNASAEVLLDIMDKNPQLLPQVLVVLHKPTTIGIDCALCYECSCSRGIRSSLKRCKPKMWRYVNASLIWQSVELRD